MREERGLRAPLKGAPETGASHGYQRRPQRRAWDAKAAAAATKNLCASTGHSPHRPSREPVQPATARLPWSGDNFPGRTHGAPQAAATSRRLCRRRLALPPLYASLPPAWVSQSPRSSCSFNPVLCEQRTDTLRRPTPRGGSKSKAEPRELYEQRREREISPSSLRSSGLNLHKKPDVPCICGVPEYTMNRLKIEAVDLGSNCGLGVCFLNQICSRIYAYLCLVCRVYYHW